MYSCKEIYWFSKKMESAGGFLWGLESTPQGGSAELSGGQLPFAGGQTPPTPHQIQPWKIQDFCLEPHVPVMLLQGGI